MASNLDQILVMRKKGKQFIKCGLVDQALECYNEAIKLGDATIVGRCHRSGLLMKKDCYEEALVDADYMIEKDPKEIMGYVRKGTALMGLKSYEEAMMAFLKGFDLDPKDVQIKEGMSKCREFLTGAKGDVPFVSPFSDLHIWDKIYMSPITKEFMRDPEYRDIIQILQKEPGKLGQYINDARIMSTMGMLLGVDMNMPNEEDNKIVEITEEEEAKEKAGKHPAELIDLTDLESGPVEEIVTGNPYEDIQTDEIAKGVVIEELGDDEDETMHHVWQDDEIAKGVVIEELDDDEEVSCAAPNLAPTTPEHTKETNKTITPEKSPKKRVLCAEPPPPEIQKEALKEKELGNAAYKKKDFDTALVHYNKAVELDPTNIVFRNNRAAVYFEQGNFEQCITECEEAVDIGRENRADYKVIAKSFARQGNAYYKKGDFENAVLYYNKSLSEHRDPDLVKKVQKIIKEAEERKLRAYIDPEKSLQEKEKGNSFFTKGNYPDAIKHYTEAIKRNPSDAKLYSNRAAAYTKLAEFTIALKDSDECIKLDPKFVKGYLRKGATLMALKETSKAADVYQRALELDPNCQEALDGYRRCSIADGDPEAVRSRAMQNPEVQEILGDPTMQLILQQMQKDPKALQEHLKNPEIAKKIEKLLEVGLIAIR